MRNVNKNCRTHNIGYFVHFRCYKASFYDGRKKGVSGYNMITRAFNDPGYKYGFWYLIDQ